MNKRCFFIIILIIFFVTLSGWAEEKKEGLNSDKKGGRKEIGFGFVRGNAPIDILSDTVEANQKQNTIIFKGNVVAKQEDITLYTNTLVVINEPETKKIKEVQAIGNVKIVQQERRATSQKAIFFQNDNKVILEGDVVIREGDNVIRGEKVTYYLNEEKSIIEGGKGGRVSTSIIPSSGEPRKK